MRAVIQRVTQASVRVNNETVGRIGPGLVVLLGAMAGDGEHDLDWMCRKVLALRIFSDTAGKMNRSVLDVARSATEGGSGTGGSISMEAMPPGQTAPPGILLVSQFTVCADVSKGNRPSFTKALPPVEAQVMVAEIARRWAEELWVAQGIFGADMKVIIENDGPVTIWLDSRERTSP